MGSWWVSARIDDTVTWQFVTKSLLPPSIDRLSRPVANQPGLPASTYWDCLSRRAKRLFLILLELGVPDRIFAILDSGWDDSELPLSLEHVRALQLTPQQDDRLDRKFHQRQYHYIVQTLEHGEHRVYSDMDQVPLDVVDKTPSLPTSKSNHVDKVRLANLPTRVFIRRKYALGGSSGSIPPHEFLDMVNIIRSVQHEHMVSYWASYTQHSHGYILLTPLSDFNLKSLLANTPSSFKALSKQDRRELVMNWILCLVDTMYFLHSKQRSHCYIKPSAVLFTGNLNIFLVDPTRLSPDASPARADKTSFDREWYDYGAPEQWLRPTGPGSPPTRQAVIASLSVSPENTGFGAGGQPSGRAPDPSQQADVFSLGCIILELLSWLLKRSTGKFASFRSAKLKKAGRGGAVLDTSFHKNLGQVEEWMSGLAKDAARKVSDTNGGTKDGAHVFKGFTPMLHLVAEMLAANPLERPSAAEVQRRTYQVLQEDCGIAKRHCDNGEADDMTSAFNQMSVNDPYAQQASFYQTQYHDFGAEAYSPSSLMERPATSSSGFSHASQNSGSTATGSSGRDSEYSYAAGRGLGSRTARGSNGWTRTAPYINAPTG